MLEAGVDIRTIQPIKEISKITKERGIYFHTDAVQTFGHYVECYIMVSVAAIVR